MDIGTFAIDHYSANGGGASDLAFQISGAENFVSTAGSNVPGYSSAAAPAGMGTSNPTHPEDAQDVAVTKAAITSPSAGFGSREYCDFVYYGGHGLIGGVFLGFNAGYGSVSAANFGFGVGYNRWAMFNACSIFNGGAPATTWQPGFKGVKAILGFKSLVFDNNLSYNLYNDFWYGWTWMEKSLLNAFFDAQADYGYKQLYPSAGLEPGCLSAQVPAGRIDYCRESFKWVNHDYTPATANSGYYYSRVIGTPIY